MRSRLPSLSVITVVRNDLVGLRRTVASLAGQTRADFQWVVVDGASQDGTYEYAGSLGAQFDMTLLRQSPQGIYPAMNAGANLASGDWLWFLNAGDFLVRADAVQVARQLVGRAASEALVATPVDAVTEDGYLYAVAPARMLVNESSVVADCNHQGTLIRTAAFSEVEGYDESLRLAADGLLMDTLLRMSGGLTQDVTLAAFVLGGASSSDIARTLAETRSYRPESYAATQSLTIQAKQAARSRILPAGASRFTSALRGTYLRRRQDRLVTSSESPKVHWNHTRDSEAGLYGCCTPSFQPLIG